MFAVERYFLIGIIVASLVGGAYLYISWQNSKIETLTKDNVLLRDTAERNSETIKNLQKQIAVQVEQNARLDLELIRSEETREEMLRIFQDHDLTRLATAKPGLIERRINDGTKKAFDDLESVTSR